MQKEETVPAEVSPSTPRGMVLVGALAPGAQQLINGCVWVRRIDKKKHKPYYFNTEEKHPQWEPPVGWSTEAKEWSALEEAKEAPETPSKPIQILDGKCWMAKIDNKKCKVYFFSLEEKKPQWHPPNGWIS